MEEERLSIGGKHKDNPKLEKSVILAGGAANAAGTKTAAGAKENTESDYIAQLVRYRGVVGQYVATGLSETVRKAAEKNAAPEVESVAIEREQVTARILKNSDSNGRDTSPAQSDLGCRNHKDIASDDSLNGRDTIEADPITMQSAFHVGKILVREDGGNERDYSLQMSQLTLLNQKVAVYRDISISSSSSCADHSKFPVENRELATEHAASYQSSTASTCPNLPSDMAKSASTSTAAKPAAAIAVSNSPPPIPSPPPSPPAPVSVPAPSSSSWSSRVKSLSPLAYLPTIPTPGYFKSGNEALEEKHSARGRESIECETDLQLTKAKNDGLITLFEEFW
jgi:hypothetical protein